MAKTRMQAVLFVTMFLACALEMHVAEAGSFGHAYHILPVFEWDTKGERSYPVQLQTCDCYRVFGISIEYMSLRKNKLCGV